MLLLAPLRYQAAALAAAVLLLGGTAADAQDIAVPGGAIAAVDSIFAPWAGTESPGCAVGVSRGGEVVLERGYGMANLETDTPIRPGSIFHVASVSKQFTAMAVMLLVREGKLSLDDDVRKFVPELPDYGQAITIRQMLTHTSGLRDQWTLLSLARGRFEEERITEADVMAIVPRQRALNFEPGMEYLYSNTGYTLAGVIVRRVTGTSLRDFAEARIFGPLGMTNTHFHDDYTMLVRGRTSAYAPRQGGTWRVSIPNYDTYGATSLFTTVGDLLRWQANFDDPVVGDRELLREMQTRAVLANGDTTGYGLGLATDRHAGRLLIGHGGADAGYRSYLGRFPDDGLSVAVLCNLATANPAALARQVADAYLGVAPATAASTAGSAPARPATARVSEAELARYAGVFHDETTDDVLFLTLRDRRLVLGRTDGPPLIPLGAGRFLVTARAAELTFGGRDQGSVEMRSTTGGSGARRFERRNVPAPSPQALAAFAGTYYSEELDATYRVTAADSTILLQTRTAMPRSLYPAFDDAFMAGGMLVLFSRAEDGRITGFRLSQGRVRGIMFVRMEEPGLDAESRGQSR
ncbi:MAG TPA: serine hydrolase domain-containing protein [Gemmatimonadaceae bacterium]|nr:serine hydrolase domain-containing protein [Gemmatimonadaceae bacterium]